MKQPIYYMVHAVNGTGAPNMKHPTYRDAVKEAKRLAFHAPNTIFTVLRVVDCYMKPLGGAYQVPLAESPEDDDLPF